MSSHRAFTLIELVLVAVLLAVISALVLPQFAREIRGGELEASARQFRSLLALVSANASFDGMRYRIRFPRENEQDFLGGRHQPIIEREEDPMYRPEHFVPLRVPWTIDVTLRGEVRCAEVRLGRPTIEELQERRLRAAEGVERAISGQKNGEERFELEFPPLFIEPDGTSEWATFVFTEAPDNVSLEDLEDHRRIEVILEGPTGLCWLQRPFYEEELDLFEEKGWPAVLRQDFLRPDELTEDDVLELREIHIKP